MRNSKKNRRGCRGARPRHHRRLRERGSIWQSSSSGTDFSKGQGDHGQGRRWHGRPGHGGRKEGPLNVITLPSNWANYGAIMKDFTAKYGIKITDANPEGSSQDEINAIEQLKGQSRAPDVVDMGTSFAVKARPAGLLAPYKVADLERHPGKRQGRQGHWYADYGGYVAIGYDPAKVKIAPTSFKSLLNPAYKNKVGHQQQPDPGRRGVRRGLGGRAGQRRLVQQHRAGYRGTSRSSTRGQLRARSSAARPPCRTARRQSSSGGTTCWPPRSARPCKGFKIVIPSDAHYAAYYDQAISDTAPNPAAARLWEEYLYSTTGQNLWLQGEARPDRAVHAGRQRHRQQDRLRGPAAGAVGHADLPDAGAVDGRRERGHPELVERGRLAHGGYHDRPRPRSRSLRSAGRAAPPPSARGLRRAGIVPFAVYMTLGLLVPTIAVAIGAFQNSSTGAFTLSNIKPPPTASTSRASRPTSCCRSLPRSCPA